jgi:hypothetical protein
LIRASIILARKKKDGLPGHRRQVTILARDRVADYPNEHEIDIDYDESHICPKPMRA